MGNINAREFYYALASVLGSAKSASLALRDVGIPGHSYILDATAYGYGKVKNFVIYDEEAIKIKEKRYYQSLDSLGFYSPTYRAISEMDFKSMPAKDLLNRIKKLPGIKAEELEWIGLPEYLEGLAQQGQKVTKEEVLAFVEAGGVKLQEVTKELKIIPVKISSLTREEFNEKWKERYWKLYLEDLLMDRAIKRWDEMSDQKKERYGNSFGNYGLRVLEEGHWTDWLSTEEFETYRELWRNGQDISYDVTYDDSTELGQYTNMKNTNYLVVRTTEKFC